MQANLEKYNAAFASSLDLQMAAVGPGLKYNEVPGWDSIGHMTLVAALEETFSVSMDTDDIVDLGSYEKGLEIMRKYNVEL